MCILDASKAFDRVNHVHLFNKLIARGIPGYIVRLLIFWYTNQKMSVRWGNVISSDFLVCNGVRQGGVLSPFLFNIYVDQLSSELNHQPVGCVISNVKINHLMYADDLVLLAPSASGLNKLLRICEDYGVSHDIKYNPVKSAVMCFRSKILVGSHLPTFHLCGTPIKEVCNIKYLGNILCIDLKGDLDILRQRRQLFAQANTILRRFHMCTIDVKLTLFRSFCSSFYNSHLWWSFKSSTFSKFNISFHNILKRFLGLSKFVSTSLICTLYNVHCCSAVLRKHRFSFLCRLQVSDNPLVESVFNSDLYYTSNIRRYLSHSLYTVYKS